MSRDERGPKHRERVFITQLRMKSNENGDYLIGNFQAADVIIQESGKTPGTFNMFLVQANLDKKKKQSGFSQGNKNNAEDQWNSDEIPF